MSVNWAAVGYGVGLLAVAAGVWIGCGAVAVGTARGRRDSEDSGRPTPVGKRH